MAQRAEVDYKQTKKQKIKKQGPIENIHTQKIHKFTKKMV